MKAHSPKSKRHAPTRLAPKRLTRYEWWLQSNPGNRSVAARAWIKLLDEERKAERPLWTDTATANEAATYYVFLSLTDEDVENIKTLAANTRFRNYGVIVRKLLMKASK